jgi:hypothetical protein
MWGYVTALVVVTGVVGAFVHAAFSGLLSWYEGLLVGLLAAVMVIGTFHQRGEHLETWRQIRSLFRRR